MCVRRMNIFLGPAPVAVAFVLCTACRVFLHNRVRRHLPWTGKACNERQRHQSAGAGQRWLFATRKLCFGARFCFASADIAQKVNATRSQDKPQHTVLQRKQHSCESWRVEACLTHLTCLLCPRHADPGQTISLEIPTFDTGKQAIEISCVRRL